MKLHIQIVNQKNHVELTGDEKEKSKQCHQFVFYIFLNKTNH
jgi:hypothetical protein